jgi:hypothetical protein
MSSAPAPKGHLTRPVRRALLALLMALAVLPAAGPTAQADPTPTPYFQWRWSGDGRAICTISAYLDSSSRWVNGKRVVRARGYFLGCDDGRTMTNGDGDLTVTGINTAGKKYGGSVGWCPSSCGKTVYIPWSGKGTYKVRVSYGDLGYLVKFGTDPTKRRSRTVTG